MAGPSGLTRSKLKDEGVGSRQPEGCASRSHQSQLKIGRVCTNAKMARTHGSTQDVQEAFDQAVARHIEYMDLMVYLRLFSTPDVVASAEQLHRSLDHLLDLTFADEIRGPGRRPFTKAGMFPGGLTEATARADCMDRREQLINHVREYLELPANTSIDRRV